MGKTIRYSEESIQKRSKNNKKEIDCKKRDKRRKEKEYQYSSKED